MELIDATYNELYRRFRPLARVEPDLGRLREAISKVPLLNKRALAAQADRTHQDAAQFFDYLDKRVGPALPEEASLPSELLVEVA